VVSLRNTADLDDFNRAIERLTAIADTVRAAQRVVLTFAPPARWRKASTGYWRNPGS
jgi:hypothetical protein